MDTANPDLHALALTVGLARTLVESDATPDDWAALTAALVSEHTPEHLANMLTGAAVLLARTQPPVTADDDPTEPEPSQPATTDDEPEVAPIL